MKYENYIKVYRVKEAISVASDNATTLERIKNWIETLTYPTYNGVGQIKDIFKIEIDNDNTYIQFIDNNNQGLYTSVLRQDISTSQKSYHQNDTAQTNSYSISIDNLVLFYYIRDKNNYVIDFIDAYNTNSNLDPWSITPSFCKFSSEKEDQSGESIVNLCLSNSSKQKSQIVIIDTINNLSSQKIAANYYFLPQRNDKYKKTILEPIQSSYIPGTLNYAFFVQGVIPNEKLIFKLHNNYYLMILGSTPYLTTSNTSLSQPNLVAGLCMQIKLTEEDEKEEEETSN